MKTKLLSIACLICAFSFTNFSYSQTALAAGDIAVILNRANAPDQFAFVTFVDLEANTVIYFTDCGADANGFAATYSGSEGVLAYTVPASGHDAGTIVRYEFDDENVPGSNFSQYSSTRFQGFVGIASAGDQIIVFQDATSPSGSVNAGDNPLFVFASNNASSAFTGNKSDSNQTGLPTGLQDTMAPLTAMGFGTGVGAEDNVDNSIYNGTYTFTSFAEAKLALTDRNNYYTIDNISEGEANENDATYLAADAAIPGALTITLSNEEFDLNDRVSIFPNPSNGNVTIKNAGVALKNIAVSDINGRIISTIDLNGATNDKTLDLTSLLSSGIYFMTISSENTSTVKKLIIK